jgi:hypothetical protein
MVETTANPAVLHCIHIPAVSTNGTTRYPAAHLGFGLERGAPNMVAEFNPAGAWFSRCVIRRDLL